MKRISAISFLLIVLFNFCGYRFVIDRMESNNSVKIEQAIDKTAYNDNDLISIKTTLNLPYYTSSAEFERTYGSITINGKDYEYVKRRVYHDTLEVLCLPNDAKTKLKEASNDIAKTSADGQSAPTKKAPSTLKISLPDFCQPIKTFDASVASAQKSVYLLSNIPIAVTHYSPPQERPPQVA